MHRSNTVLASLAAVAASAACLIAGQAACRDASPSAATGGGLPVVSDASTLFSTDGKDWKPAAATYAYPDWPTLDGATWIWRDAQVSSDEAARGSPTVSFKRTFEAPARSAATLRVDADNAYRASLNGKLIGSSGPLKASSNLDQLWHSVRSYKVALKPGTNVLLVQAINYRSPLGASADYRSNPAGVIFRLDAADSGSAVAGRHRSRRH